MWGVASGLSVIISASQLTCVLHCSVYCQRDGVVTLILKNTSLRHGSTMLFSPTSTSLKLRRGSSCWVQPDSNSQASVSVLKLHILDCKEMVSFVPFPGNASSACRSPDHSLVPAPSGSTSTYLSINMISIQNPQYNICLINRTSNS